MNERTGVAELSMDMRNPRVVYAAMWEHGRRPWQVISGGPGSGLYKSVDGGDTWEKMTKGLPDKMGKMAIAVSRSNPNKVYALIESDSYSPARGLYMSADAGRTWSQVTSEPRLLQRAWYYIKVFVDPKDENRLYVMSAPALRSNDGGKTWEEVPTQHGDTHNLWINPDNSDNFILFDDGGAAITFDRGKSWSSLGTEPTGQFYRINVDNQFPYRIYSAQQDNSSVVIASQELANDGITTDSWTSSAGGESAFLAFDPERPAVRDGRQLRGHDRRPRHEGARGHEHHAGADPVPGDGREGHEVPLRLERADHLEQVGAEHLLSRRPGPAQDDRPRQDVEGDLPRPHPEREGQAGEGRRPVHQRGGGRRDLWRAHLRGGVAPREAA